MPQQVDEGETHEEDISATVKESNVRKNVNQNVNLQHRIIVDQCDVWQLVHNKELKKKKNNQHDGKAVPRAQTSHT